MHLKKFENKKNTKKTKNTIEQRRSLFLISLVCIILLSGGCGKADTNASAGENESSPSENTAEREAYKEPPQITLFATADETDSMALSACSYTWNYQISEEVMSGGVADAPHPLEAKSAMLNLPGDSLEAEYRLSFPVLPDTFGIRAWELTDIGNSNAQSVTIATAYNKEEAAAANFSVSLEAGKVYEFFLEWNKEELAKNGFYGTAGYVFKTAVPVTGDGQQDVQNEETGKMADASYEVILPESSIRSFRVTKQGSGEVEERGVYSSDLGFQEVMDQYLKLDIAPDENQHPGEGFLYQLQFLDLDSQVIQTIDFADDYLVIDGVRYRNTGTGTAGELFLAVDALFPEEDMPTATFGAEYTGEIDRLEGVEMTATYATPKGVNLVFTNNTDQEILFGDDYELQAWKDDSWYEVDYIIDNYAFNAIGYMTAGNGVNCWESKWTYFHGILPEGKYRITKSVSVEKEGENVHYTLGAEFLVD